MAVGGTPRLVRILAALDGHFAADDISPADAGRWRARSSGICDSGSVRIQRDEAKERHGCDMGNVVGFIFRHVASLPWATRLATVAMSGSRKMLGSRNYRKWQRTRRSQAN
jgi:hypothetical protein